MSYNCWEVNIPREIYFSGHVIYKNNHRNTHNLLNVVWQEKSLQHIFQAVYFPYLSQIHCWRLKLPPKTWLPELFLEWKKAFFFFFHILKVPWNSSACFTFSLSHIPSLAPCPVTVRLSKPPNPYRLDFRERLAPVRGGQRRKLQSEVNQTALKHIRLNFSVFLFF